MCTPDQTVPAAEIQIPICPHCEQELPNVGMFSWESGPWLILEIHCIHCRRVLHMQVVPNLAAAQKLESGLIARPH